MGYIDASGTYHEGLPRIADLVTDKSINWKQTDHDRQRQDHKEDLLRPYNADGTPSEEFIQAYPLESKRIYKFIPDDDEIARSQ